MTNIDYFAFACGANRYYAADRRCELGITEPGFRRLQLGLGVQRLRPCGGHRALCRIGLVRARLRGVDISLGGAYLVFSRAHRRLLGFELRRSLVRLLLGGYTLPGKFYGPPGVVLYSLEVSLALGQSRLRPQQPGLRIDHAAGSFSCCLLLGGSGLRYLRPQAGHHGLCCLPFGGELLRVKHRNGVTRLDLVAFIHCQTRHPPHHFWADYNLVGVHGAN